MMRTFVLELVLDARGGRCEIVEMACLQATSRWPQREKSHSIPSSLTIRSTGQWTRARRRTCATDFAAIALDQRGHRQLIPVSTMPPLRSLRPSPAIRLEPREPHATLRQYSRCRKAAETSADDGNIHLVGKAPVAPAGRLATVSSQ